MFQVFGVMQGENLSPLLFDYVATDPTTWQQTPDLRRPVEDDDEDASVRCNLGFGLLGGQCRGLSAAG